MAVNSKSRRSTTEKAEGTTKRGTANKAKKAAGTPAKKSSKKTVEKTEKANPAEKSRKTATSAAKGPSPKTKTPAARKATSAKGATAKASVKARATTKATAVPTSNVTVTATRGKKSESLLIRGGTLVTMNQVREILRADVRVADGEIQALGKLRPRAGEKVFDATGLTLFPGFIQLHVHLCQTIFRHMAEDMTLFDWLRTRIWPLEAAHNRASLVASARLAIAELLLSGTTTCCTMETVDGSEHIFETIVDSGLRAFSGPALMDGGRGVPKSMRPKTSKMIDTWQKLHAEWNGKGRLQITLNPRFAPSCSPDLLREVKRLAAETGSWIHTHIAETRDEVQLTREAFGRNPALLYQDLGYLEEKFIGAHGVFLSEQEKVLLSSNPHNVIVHCPSANMKLGSGIAPVVDLLGRRISVGIGADGAACNNNLDVVQEMRLAGLLQKLNRGPDSISAETLLSLVTIDAATALGLNESLGSLEVGKRADIGFFDLNQPGVGPVGTPAQQLVWSASSRDLRHTMVDGSFLVKDRKLQLWPKDDVLATAGKEAQRLMERAF